MKTETTPAGPLNLIPIAITGALCTLAFGPVFGGAPGYLAAGGGVLLGLALAWLSAARKWGVAVTTTVGILAYLAVVGPLALTDTTIAGFLPTLETVQRGTLLVVQGWRDLLTVAVPAGVFSGPAVVPLLSSLICTTVAGRLALTERWYPAAGAPMLVLLVVAILWGIGRAPLGGWIGLGFVVVLTGWTAIRYARARADAQRLAGFATEQGVDARRLVAAAALLAVAGGTALAVSPLLTGPNRFVLRHVIEPPLDLRNYASPLMSYRYLELDQKEVSQFSVDGLPEGARVRVATLDVYNGIVYDVTDNSAEFARAGAEIEPRGVASAQAATATTLRVAIDQYQGVWLPGGGDLRGVSFGGQQATEQSRSLYYNSNTGTAIVTAGLSEGDEYDVALVTSPAVDREVLAAHGIQAQPLPNHERVPDAVIKKSAEIVAGHATPVDQVLAIEQALQEGYYSDGSDGQSLSGHSEARIESLLSLPQMIGDDEQYAVAMALMLGQLGIPARVVMGFYPSGEVSVADGWQARGTDAHVWVEVPFNDLGWVSFDPTPDRDRRPETIVPRPNPKPRPMVQPPPIPPQEPLEAPIQLSDDDARPDDGFQINWALVKLIATVLGLAALAAAPFLLLAALRRRRGMIRRNAELPADRLTGGWAEVVDTATDLGMALSPRQTRREQALALAAVTPDADLVRLASAIDRGVFGGGTPRDDYVERVWDHIGAAVTALRGSAGRWRRLAYWGTPKSLVRPAAAGPVTQREALIQPLLRRKP